MSTTDTAAEVTAAETAPAVTTAPAMTHGEIVSWEVTNGMKVRFDDLKAAIAAAGLNPKLVREMHPRNAFARACCDLSERRVIRKLAESTSTLTFQFTREATVDGAAGKRFEYDYEATMILHKATGLVECADRPDLAAEATALVKAESEIRYASDITSVAQRAFEQSADLFPVRAQGGCYFCPAAFTDLLDRVEHFLSLVGGGLRRFPIMAGSKGGDRSVKESVEDGLAGVIREHVLAIDKFDETTREDTLKKMADRIMATRFKVEAYADFLADARAELLTKLEAAKDTLREKVGRIGKAA